MTYRGASSYIMKELSHDRPFASSLIMCLDRKKHCWKINLEAIGRSQEDLFAFEHYGTYDKGKVLMLVGRKSF